MFSFKALLKPHYKCGDEFLSYSWSNYSPEIPDPFVSEVSIEWNGVDACRLQNGTGHCCGSFFLSNLYRVAVHWDELVSFLTSKIGMYPDGVNWRLQNRVFFYLSDETKGWDSVIRNHPQVKVLYSFNNKATKPYTGSNVDLCVLEL